MLNSTNNNSMKGSVDSGAVVRDFGLLVLRVFLGANLFWRHGLPKIQYFSQIAGHFPDPIHIGSHASLIFALISDAICSVLVVLGLATRVAALIVFVNIGVVFVLVAHHPFLSPEGELLLLFIGGFLALVFTGGGRFSLDSIFFGRS
jgi:putative oxidoreductase